MTITIMIVMGLLGILFYTLFKAKEYLITDTFIVAKFFKENIATWLWALIFLAAAAVTLNLEPTANLLIKSFTGFDLENTKTGWLVFGSVLCGLVRNVKK